MQVDSWSPQLILEKNWQNLILCHEENTKEAKLDSKLQISDGQKVVRVVEMTGDLLFNGHRALARKMDNVVITLKHECIQ